MLYCLGSRAGVWFCGVVGMLLLFAGDELVSRFPLSIFFN